MPDDSKAAPSPVIPADILQKFPDLLQLIQGSESMNNEERQYWVSILPVMTDEQIKNLREILENEKKQLQAIDEKYSKEIDAVGQQQSVKATEEERKQKRETRKKSESTNQAEEEQKAEDILKSIEGL